MTRQKAGFLINSLSLLVLTLALLPGGDARGESVQAAGAEEAHTVTVSIPEVIRLDVSLDEVVFDLSIKPEDTLAFPTYYTPNTRQFAEVKVLSNVDREWQLKLEGETSGGLPAENIEWSLDDNNWHVLRKQETVVTVGSFTKGWQEIRIYYRLLVTGAEYAGKYRLQVKYGLTVI